MVSSERPTIDIAGLGAAGASPISLKLVVVAGPVVVHTGGSIHFQELVRSGYVSVLLAGNALAVHDVEQALFGTSLGVDLESGHLAVTRQDDNIEALDEALSQLAETDPVAARLVQLRYFAGLTTEQAAAALGISVRSAYYTWSYARSWLRRAIREK